MYMTQSVILSLTSHEPKTFNNNSYIANSRLCGSPLSKKCGTVQSPLANHHSDEEKFPSEFESVFILVRLGSALVVGFVIGKI